MRLAADGAAARATAHGGLAGTGPWWATAPGWRPIGARPVIYRAAGSHANGFAPTGHRSGRRPLERHARRGRPVVRRRRPGAVAAVPVRPAASPPWMKRLWRDPDAAGTGADGTQGREVAAARAWAAAWEGLGSLPR